MSIQVGIALIGAGGIGRHLARQAVQVPEIRLKGVFDTLPESAQTLAQELNLLLYPSLEAVWEDTEVQAVIVATPPFTHRELCEQAFASGKHVFCEKPMAVFLEDCDAILKSARRAQRLLMVGQVLRLFPLFWQSKQWLSAGMIGEPFAFSIRRTGDDIGIFGTGWRKEFAKSGGIIVEMNVHELDYLRWLGGSLKPVSAQGFRLFPEAGYTQHWQGLLRFESGAIAQIESSILDTLGNYQVRIVGTEGTLEHTGFRGTIQYRTRKGDSAALSTEEVGTLEPYFWELQNFARAILYDEPLLFDGTDGREAVALAHACVELIEQGYPDEL